MNNQKPCLVPAGQGFSVLYNNRYLFSKYNPVQSCERLISSLHILPGSLIVVFSPVLGYGLQSLIHKIDSDSYIIAVETDPVLFDFSLPYIDKYRSNSQFEYLYITPDTDGISLFLNRCSKIVKEEKRFFFRRLLTLNPAASTQTEEFKSIFTSYTDSFIDFFWKNRITITKMGRLYARNIFKNLPFLSSSSKLMQNSIHKPIIVLGAGISLESVIPYLRLHKDDFFIICVDSAVMPLLENGIRPHIIEAVECQLANVKAFIGSKNTHIHLNTDLTARPRVHEILNGNLSFFLSEYESSSFLNRLKESIPVRIVPPLGSVGLAAVHTALFLRAPDVPVFFSGLDFSYIPGKTHCKSAPIHRYMLMTSNRLTSTGSHTGFFNKGTEFCGKNCITDFALKKYALLFDEEFKGITGLYNLSKLSLITKIPYVTIDALESYTADFSNLEFPKPLEGLAYVKKTDPDLRTTITLFLKNEKENLLKIKNCLIHGSLSERELLTLLEQHDYLYLHFPDGYKKPDLSQGFLKRIRAEIDFFLKDIESALSNQE